MKKILSEKSSRTTFFTVCVCISWIGLFSYDSYMMGAGLPEYATVYRNGGYSIFAIIFIPLFRWVYRDSIDKYVERVSSASASATIIFLSALLSFPLLYMLIAIPIYIIILILSS